MLMSIAGDEIIRNFGIQVKYVNVYDLSEKLKNHLKIKSISTAKIIEEHKTAQILILDDIDKINPTPFIVDLMYGIANYRAENNLPTWVNANHSMKRIRRKLLRTGAI